MLLRLVHVSRFIVDPLVVPLLGTVSFKEREQVAVHRAGPMRVVDLFRRARSMTMFSFAANDSFHKRK